VEEEKKIKSEKNISQTIEAAHNLINELTNIESFTEEDLSKKALYLSVIKPTISQSESELEYNLRLIKAQKKTLYEDTYLKLKHFKEYSQEDRKVMANKELRPLEIKEVKVKFLLKNVSNLKEDITQILSTIHNRIHTLRLTKNKQNTLFN